MKPSLIVLGLLMHASCAMGSVASLREAITDLATTYGDDYPNGATYLKRLDALGANPPEQTLEALRREALLAHPRLMNQALLVLDRDSKPKTLPQNWQGNESLRRSNISNRIAVLRNLQGELELKTLYEPENQKLITHIDLHADGDRLLFSMLGAKNRWQIFEMGLENGGASMPRPLPLIEQSDVDNYDACYLPDGRILFTSTATYTGVPCVAGSTQVANLHNYTPKTGAIRRLTFDQEHNWDPTVMPDGRVMYLRWEYSDLPHSNSRILFQMNPDGTNQSELYGSNSYFPNSFFYARPMPGHPSKLVGVAGGHHGVARAGRLLILDPTIDRREANGVVHEFPHRGRVVKALVKDQLVKDVWPQFLMPFPLDQKHVLVSCKLSPKSPWGVYLVDVFDNLTLIHQLPGRSLLEPVLLARSAPAPVIPDRVNLKREDATVLLSDIYQGPGLEGVPRGAVKNLRVVEYYFSMRNMGGLLGSVGMDGPWDIRRVLGTVPVEEDGSAHFKIPAERPVMVQPLDEKGQALQTMRSWFTGMPGERMSCIGCHADISKAPPSMPALAATRPPSVIKATWQAPVRGFSYEREIQPVLNRHCVSCHDGGGDTPDLSGGRMVKDWESNIAGNANKYGGKFSESYAELHRYVRRSGIESDMRILSPMDYHFSATGLGQMLSRGHHGVKLDKESFERVVTWVDINAPYHGTWGEIIGKEKVDQSLARANALRRPYTVGPLPEYETIPTLPPYDDSPVKPIAVPNPSLRKLTVVVDKTAKKQQRRRVDLGQGVMIELVKVPRGALNGQVVDPFWVGTTEVTNAQFRRFKANHDSRDESRHGYQFGRRGYDMNQDPQPAVRVSWNEARAFTQWLASEHELQAALPSASQWEWACRAGTTSAFPFGGVNADYSKHANIGDRRLKEFAACTAREHYHAAEPIKNPNRFDDWVPRDDRFDDGGFVTMAVAGYQPNAWGLHDTIGNAWEWTSEVGSNDERAARGGSWYDRPARATIDDRVLYAPYQRVFNVGFRIVVPAN